MAAEIFTGQENPSREEEGDEEGERDLQISFVVKEEVHVIHAVGEEAGEEEVGWPEEEAGDVRGEAWGPAGVAEKAGEARAGEEWDRGGGCGPEDGEESARDSQGAHIKP